MRPRWQAAEKWRARTEKKAENNGGVKSAWLYLSRRPRSVFRADASPKYRVGFRGRFRLVPAMLPAIIAASVAVVQGWRRAPAWPPHQFLTPGKISGGGQAGPHGKLKIAC